MNERDYLSIGEVLSVLLNEFPDVTISKIRFLEGQGLIEPERTPSGYRKFSPGEVERLRYILREQREKYLPLRVIRNNLDESTDISMEISADSLDETATIERSERSHPAARLGTHRMHTPQPNTAAAEAQSVRASPIVTEEADSAMIPQPDSVAAAHGDITESLPRDTVMSQLGLEHEFLRELESSGLIRGHQVGNTTFYDPHSISLARVADRFRELGIDLRHLRAWKIAADKESNLFEQRILPIMRQRNPGARDEAISLLTELVQLGSELREILMRREIDRLGDGR